MESFFSRFKNALVLIAILLVQTLALATQIHRPEDTAHPDGKHVRLIRLWAFALVTPFERLSTGSGHGIRSAWSNYIALRSVRRQNLDLQHQIADLRLEQAALAQDALQGQRLQRLLDFQQTYIAKTIVAQVIAASASDAGRLLTLNKGARDGLTPDMAVITPDGIVGKLRDVFPSTSQLLLLSDPTSGAGVILQSTRTRAVLRGTPSGRIVIDNLTADARIHPGDLVLTSGGDQVFPRGLPVGTIESIAPDPDHQPYTTIRIHPAADLNRLDEVLIVTALGPLPPQLQADLTTEATTHAADSRADRLPTLHDPTINPEATLAPPTEPQNPDKQNATPKPKPTLHPDKYTPADVPPATALTPGAPH